MAGTFVITLREAFEAALLLGIVYAYLDRIGRRQDSRYVTLGAVLGAVASVGLGLAVGFLSGPLLDLGPDLVATVVIFAAVGLITWHGWWMQQHARAIRDDVQRRIDAAEATSRLWLVGLIAFTGVFREGAETVLFLWGLLSQAASPTGWGPVVGGAAGVAAAAGLGWAIFCGGTRVSLPRFFGATSLILLFLSAGLFSTGIGKLEGLGLLPPSRTLWDTSALLDDRGVVGGFLGSLVGYRARPSALEAGAYLTYLVVASVLFFGHRTADSGSGSGPERSEASRARQRAGAPAGR